MRRQFVCAFVLLFAATAMARAAEGPTLKEARQRWLKGNYEEARERYETLARDAKQQVAATVGLSRVFQSLGEYDKALETLDAVLKDKPKDADLLARRAELLYLRGRWDDAEKAAETALAEDKDHSLLRPSGL